MERRRYARKLEDMSIFIKRKYCSRECMRKAYIKKDGIGQQWSTAHHSARSIAYSIKEMPKVCELCGSDRNIDVHHKDGNHLNNSFDNLITVCRSCHLKLHRKKSVCIICGEPAKGHGYCNMHYIRWKKYGNPLYYYGKMVSSVFTERKKAQQLSLF